MADLVQNLSRIPGIAQGITEIPDQFLSGLLRAAAPGAMMPPRPPGSMYAPSPAAPASILPEHRGQYSQFLNEYMKSRAPGLPAPREDDLIRGWNQYLDRKPKQVGMGLGDEIATYL